MFDKYKIYVTAFQGDFMWKLMEQYICLRRNNQYPMSGPVPGHLTGHPAHDKYKSVLYNNNNKYLKLLKTAFNKEFFVNQSENTGGEEWIS